MILDPSALVAILQDEPERRTFTEAIEAAEVCRMSVAGFVEASMVIASRYGADGLVELDLFLDRAAVELVPVDVEQGRLARNAFRRYGKGRDAAGLNFGDCFSYALARAAGEPLLFKGDDFRRTDLVAAIDR